MQGERVDAQERSREVRRERDAVHVADLEQRLEPRLADARAERVPEEDDELDAVLRDERPELQITAERSRGDELDVETELLGDEPAGPGRGDEAIGLDLVEALCHELEQLVLATVVGDQRDPLRHGCDATRGTGPPGQRFGQGMATTSSTAPACSRRRSACG